MDSESLDPITQVKPYLWIFSFAGIAKLPNSYTNFYFHQQDVRVLVFRIFANIRQY